MMAPPFSMVSPMGKGAHRVGARLGNLAATHKRKTQELTLGYLLHNGYRFTEGQSTWFKNL